MNRIVSAALGCLLVAGSSSLPANAQSMGASTVATPESCPAYVRAYAIPGMPNELAFGMWSESGRATTNGSIIAYVNGGRYEIPFANAVIPEERDSSTGPTPIVVAFDGPVNFESAYVGSIEGTPCAIHSPFAQKPLSKSLANADTVAPMQAPAPQAASKLPCANAYAEPAVVDARPAHIAQYYNGNGSVTVHVDIDANGKATAMHLDKSDRATALTESAVIAAARSTYSPQIFRCEAVSSSVSNTISFVPISNAPGMLFDAKPTLIGDTVRSSGYHYEK